MKITKIVTFAAGLALSATISRAQVAHVWNDPQGWWGGHFTYAAEADKYTGSELSFDAFGSYVNPEHHLSNLFDRNIHHGTWGGGVGLNYFFTRELGIGGDINIPNNGHNFVDDVAGNLIARVPLGNSGVAPYIFGGGGRAFDPLYQWFGDAGVGLEFRFNPVTGLFVDGRYVWGDRGVDSALFRAGLRFVF